MSGPDQDGSNNYKVGMDGDNTDRSRRGRTGVPVEGNFAGGKRTMIGSSSSCRPGRSSKTLATGRDRADSPFGAERRRATEPEEGKTMYTRSDRSSGTRLSGVTARARRRLVGAASAAGVIALALSIGGAPAGAAPNAPGACPSPDSG